MSANYECFMCGGYTAGAKFCSCRCEREYNYENRTCQVCGGEFWNGGTSCTCQNWKDEEPCHIRRRTRPQLYKRFPDHYHRNTDMGLLPNTRFYRALWSKQKVLFQLLKRVASGKRYKDELPF